MKKLIFGVIAVLFIVTYFVVSNLIDSGKGFSHLANITAPSISTKVYNLEANGFNKRLYTFKHPDTGKLCVSVDSSVGSGVDCDWKYYE